jgi:hypothetical protein
LFFDERSGALNEIRTGQGLWGLFRHGLFKEPIIKAAGTEAPKSRFIPISWGFHQDFLPKWTPPGYDTAYV